MRLGCWAERRWTTEHTKVAGNEEALGGSGHPNLEGPTFTGEGAWTWARMIRAGLRLGTSAQVAYKESGRREA